ncbi:MAG: hypothetical protein IT545_03675 [Rhodobacteraceae bacterium]|nr:hypothetical protein [Paracoccaceae bacterium]
MARPAAALERLILRLEEEGRALRAGRIALLAAAAGPAAAETEALLAGLARPLPEAAGLARLRRLAAENATLLAAAAEGIRDARARLLARAAAVAGTTTYDVRGRARPLAATAAGRLERRA